MTKNVFSAHEARKVLGELINRVHYRGEEIVIQKKGGVAARLVPVHNNESNSEHDDAKISHQRKLFEEFGDFIKRLSREFDTTSNSTHGRR